MAVLQRALSLGEGAAFVLLGAAGIGKLVDLPGFAASLRAWQIVPPLAVAVLVAMIPAAEVLLAGLWLAGIARGRCAIVSLGFVVGISAALAALYFLTDRPIACGCYGKVGEWLRISDEAPSALARNGALAGLLACGVFRHRRAGEQTLTPPSGNGEESRVSPAGFTLLETLLCVTLVALLLTLTLPKLAAARRAAHDAGSAAHLRSHAQVFAQYTTDYRGLLPYFTDPKADVSIVRCESRGIALPGRYFDAFLLWGVALADGYYDGDPTHPSMYAPGSIGGGYSGGFLSSYHYGCVFIADPGYWNLSSRLIEPLQFHPIRLDQAAFPDRKSLHINNDRYFRMMPRDGDAWFPGSTDMQASFLDGHAEIVASNRQHPDIAGGCWTRGDWGRHTASIPPFLHTLDGIRGRDVD